MRTAFWQRLAVLTALGLGVGGFSHLDSAVAAQFEQQEIDQSRFIVLAAPGGDIGYKLLILEQIKDDRPCWSETGERPSNVEPLLLSFDFTGICNRIVDSNGFSVRTAGVDQGLQYSLRIIRDNNNNDLVLVAASNTDRNAVVEVGRTQGMPSGFSRIVLGPGWRLTRRAFNGRSVGHVYLTYDQPMETLIASSRRNVGGGSSTGNRPVSPVPLSPTPSNSPAPGAPADSTTDPTNVIPVPSLPPGSPTPPAPLRPIVPATPPANRPAPNLSSILPPPPPPEASEAAIDAAPAPAGSASGRTVTGRTGTGRTRTGRATGATAAQPAPALGSTGATGADPSSNTGSSADAGGNTSNPDADSDANVITTPPRRTATRPNTTPAPSRVPSASTSGGALLRPRSLRRDSNSSTSSAARTRSSDSNRSSDSTTARSAGRTNRSSQASRSQTAGSGQGADASTNTSADTSADISTVAQAETYQVVVVADDAEAQDKVRSLAPNAFLTSINGQVVMQVGVFRDRQEADRLQQRLSLEGLPTAVIPVR